MNRPSTSQSSSTGWPTAAELAAKERARRPKAQLSCVPCRAKKQKCDRARPCKNCAKVYPNKCVYVANSPLKERIHASGTSGRAKAGRLQDRLQQLESRIAFLADKAAKASDGHGGSISSIDHRLNQSTGSPKGSSDADSLELSPRIAADQDDPHFISPSHWEGVLSELAGIKQELGSYKSPFGMDSEADVSRAPEDIGPQLLFANRDRLSQEELISALPPKTVVQDLMHDFTQQHGVPPLLTVVFHQQTFLEELEAFWENPMGASVTWLSILYSILSLALQNVIRSGSSVEGILIPRTSCKNFMIKATQCLAASDYAKPIKYTCEAMIFYLACEHFFMEKEPFRASLVYGLIVRVAHRMGYHYDPSHYPQLSIFDAEMQRRTWALILQMDLFLAGKCGLPRLINHAAANTLPPLNLLDEDLSRDMLEHPRPRPDSERTNIGYLNYKTRLLTTHARIVDRISASESMSNEEILRLDKDLASQVDTRPIWLHPPDEAKAREIPLKALGPLVDTDLIIQRSRMILHRKSVVAARHNADYSYSRNLGLAAAKQALLYQRVLFYAAAGEMVNGQKNWRHLSLLSHDFLMGGMVLCLDVNQDLLQQHSDEESQSRLRDHMQLLHASFEIWEATQEHSPSAQEGYDVLKAMLDKFQRMQQQQAYPPGFATAQEVRSRTSSVDDLLSPQVPTVPQQGLPMHQRDLAPPMAYQPQMEMGMTGQQPAFPTMDLGITPMPQVPQPTNMDPMMIDNSMMGIDWAGWDPNFYGGSMGMF